MIHSSVPSSMVPILSIDCELPLTEVYERIEWSNEDAALWWLRSIKEPSEAYLA